MELGMGIPDWDGEMGKAGRSQNPVLTGFRETLRVGIILIDRSQGEW
jgi:hypothetical protein